MATVAPMSTWIPEDDILLKNAIEAGASLEALAKGAVQFSRKFTYRELRDRWHSLLYDPVISAQASAFMVERELSTSGLSSKFNNKLEISKESKETHVKRKLGSIRRQYYAMRKKLKSEFLNSADLSFLTEHDLHDYAGNGGQFEEHMGLDNQPLDGACMSNHFELQETDFDILRHAFPETIRDITTANAVDSTGDAFDTGHTDLFEDNPRDRIAGSNFLFEFHEDSTHLSVKESSRDDGLESFQQNITPGDISHTFEHSAVDYEKNSNGGEMVPLPALSDGKLLKADNSETMPLSTSNLINDDPQNFSTEFGGKQSVCSPASDCNVVIHSSEFSSPLPTMPLWKTMEDISAPAMPVDMGLHGATQSAERISTLTEDGAHMKKGCEAVYDDTHSGPSLRDEHSGNGFINSTAMTGGEFVDLSDSLLNFSNEDEILFMDVDGKDAMDNINSTLLSCSTDTHKDDIPNVLPETLLDSDTCFATPSGVCLAESEAIASPRASLHNDQENVSRSEAHMPSTSLLNSESVRSNDLSLCCTLNTEDPEIPCNDDIFLLIHPTSSFVSAMEPISTDTMNMVSSCANERGFNLAKHGKDPAQSFSQIGGRKNLPETSPNHMGGSVGKSEHADANYLDLVPRYTSKVFGDTNHCRISHTTSSTTVDRPLEKDVVKLESGVVDTPAEFVEMPSYAEAGSAKLTLPESVMNPSTSDQEESESDNDVPYFSDIEAMILEMDLGPCDQDSYISRQVSRYQLEASKRTIIRLEQCARSSLHRAMASQGAFAVLYGRRLKHYIRKMEVILGRSTNDVNVDIDLGVEGRANKISRRQAVIKIETDGTFILKNLGKSTISVNGRVVATGHFLNLSSSCLIEIRGMNFVFEMNPKSVRRYLDAVARKSQGENTHFEWMPEGEP